MRYTEALAFLEGIQPENFKLTLDNIQTVIDHFPVDLSAIRFLQVAGTNGKGSTSHFLASILRQGGHGVGLFTSPHLSDVRERIRVGGRMISRRDFAACLSAVRAIAEDLLRRKRLANLPTFFEFLFLAALWHFSALKVEWAVLEVGLGGRLDATTTVRPELAIITNITKDHTQILGRRIRDIAGEKAGVIKTGVAVVCGCAPRSGSLRVIAAAARRRRAPFYPVFGQGRRLDVTRKNGHYDCRYRTEQDEYRFQVRLSGVHQTKNAATAVRAVEVLNLHGAGIPLPALIAGIARMSIPGRIEIFRTRPPILLDVAHNPDGIGALARFLEDKGIRDATLIFGVLKDKNYRRMAARIKPFAGRVILSEPVSSRALAPEKLRACFAGLDVRIERDFDQALDLALDRKKYIIICGSFYLAGKMRTIILRRNKRGCQEI